MDFVTILIIVGVLVVALLLIAAMVARLYRKVGPNEALIVYGFGGTKVVKGSGKVIWPMIQQSRGLSLELMSFDVAPTQDLYTNQGVAVNVEAVAQIKVKSDPVSILTASEQFLSMEYSEMQSLIRLVMEGHLRGITGQLTVESIVKEPEMVADRMRANVAEDMAKMGLEVVSFTIREVKDSNDYILNMGKPDVAIVRRTADIAMAEAERDTAIRRAQAMREARIAEAAAEQEKVSAESLSQTKQAEAVRDLDLKRAEYDRSVQEQRALADKAYEIQANVQQQRIVAEQVRVEQVRKEGEIAVQEAEKQRQVLRAQAVAEQTKLEGEAQALIVRLQGQAEADVILAKGQSEANAMQIKAEAFQNYNQAAILDQLIGQMPEMVRAIAEPLNRVDKITVVSTGGDGENGGATGVNRLAGDMTSMVAQVPALLEALTGIRMDELLKHVPGTQENYRKRSTAPTPARTPSSSEPRPPYVDAEPVDGENKEATVASASAPNSHKA
jgi:flotillin